MDEDYCFGCGAYTAINRLTKMCGRCYDRWYAGPGSASGNAARHFGARLAQRGPRFTVAALAR
jgi:hypothetical protein